MFSKTLTISVLVWVFISTEVYAGITDREDVKSFIETMVNRYGFEREQLTETFAAVRVSEKVLEAISRPAESLPWYKYRPIFLRQDRIRLGVEFIEKHHELLSRAEESYGVPKEIITAIIGVETRYGQHKGGYKVMDSLTTLAFFYPERSRFFRSELEQFLLMSREQGLDPHQVKGSYAGAMGIPQFISSSYRNYAVDFDGDDRIDIWSNPADAIGSVANYFKVHGWEKGKKITVSALVDGEQYTRIMVNGLEPHIRVVELSDYGIYPKEPLHSNSMVKLLKLEQEEGSEFWLGLNNFYVITRYNHSALYAMAAYQLAQEIKSRYAEELAENMR